MTLLLNYCFAACLWQVKPRPNEKLSEKRKSTMIKTRKRVHACAFQYNFSQVTTNQGHVPNSRRR